MSAVPTPRPAAGASPPPPPPPTAPPAARPAPSPTPAPAPPPGPGPAPTPGAAAGPAPPHIEISGTRELQAAEVFAQSRGAGPGFPAALMGDTHTCPMPLPSGNPHGLGAIVTGAARTLISSKPAARQLDVAACAGPPNFIAEGEPKVLVEAQPLARVFHMTQHGGTVLGPGAPTVLLGPPSGAAAERYPRHEYEKGPDGKMRLVTKYSPMVTIGGGGDKDTLQKQFEAIKSLEEVKLFSKKGKERLEKLDKPVRISEHAPPGGTTKIPGVGEVVSLKKFEEDSLGTIAIKVNVKLKGYEKEKPVKWIKSIEVRPGFELVGKLTKKEGGTAATLAGTARALEGEISGDLSAVVPKTLLGFIELGSPSYEVKVGEVDPVKGEVTLFVLAFKIEGKVGSYEVAVRSQKFKVDGALQFAINVVELGWDNAKREIKRSFVSFELEGSVKGSGEFWETKYGTVGAELKLYVGVKVQPDWAQIAEDVSPKLRAGARLLTTPAGLFVIGFIVSAVAAYGLYRFIYDEIHAARDAAEAYHRFRNQYMTGVSRGLRGDGSGGPAFEAFGKADGVAHRQKALEEWKKSNAKAIEDYRRLRGLDGAPAATVDAEIQQDFDAHFATKEAKYLADADTQLAPVRDKVFLEFIEQNPSSFQCHALFLSLGYGKIPWSKVPERVRQAYGKCPGYQKYILPDEPAKPPPPPPTPEQLEEQKKLREKFEARDKLLTQVREWQARTKRTAHDYNVFNVGKPKITAEDADLLDREYKARTGTTPIGSKLSPF